ncbi:ABC transporter [Candidatus Methylobacter favarea]|uniref:ABC transporter n=1 Tax=Candidatus Methylobacter favarea TaxID=2707345 RepID=A0A8S0WCD9_9GAMM|nr:ATP-binding cassette domain-containing protein [Candidatus Methylobacter favarea]CAA9892445.1 ABC transporter [Candidatus Methylobacter favarea]
MTAMINVKDLNFSYGSGELQLQVLKRVNLTIYSGEIVLMTGPSGSGKTTLLTIIGGLRQAAEGSALVLGKQLVNSIEKTKVQIRQQIGYIFQQHNLLKSLTALQNVCMTLEMHNGLNEQERLKRSAEMLSAVGLADRLHHKPDQLSGGQRQRVSIARALVGNPKIILADEPTASLDKQSGQEAVGILKTLASDSGTTILLVTHDYRILDIADRVVELEDGIIKS